MTSPLPNQPDLRRLLEARRERLTDALTDALAPNAGQAVVEARVMAEATMIDMEALLLVLEQRGLISGPDFLQASGDLLAARLRELGVTPPGEPQPH